MVATIRASRCQAHRSTNILTLHWKWTLSEKCLKTIKEAKTHEIQMCIGHLRTSGRRFHNFVLHKKKLTSISCQSYAGKLAVGNDYIYRTRRRVACANLLHITIDVPRRAAHCCCRGKGALLRAACAVAWVALGCPFKLACCSIAARRISAYTWITIFPFFDNAISTHLKGDGLAIRVRVNKATCVNLATLYALHRST